MSNVTISLRYSDDGGENWSHWRELDGGDTGNFLVQLVARRLGITRYRIWEIRDTSPVCSDILAAEVMAE